MSKKYNVFADYQTVDGAAIAQMESAMAKDFAIRGALMPDTHAGYALPIGAVVETKDAVVPAWVGYDIGCGVSTVKLDMTKDQFSILVLEKLKEEILKRVPVGNDRFKTESKEYRLFNDLSEIGKKVYQKRALGQLGTLGGGNHFIEIGHDEDDAVYITIHSGSRGFGHGLATEYMRIAANQNGVERGNFEGHFSLEKGTPEYTDYLSDAIVAQQYAVDNRGAMTSAIQDAIKAIFGVRPNVLLSVNQNHNHVEPSDKPDHWIHRKGATHAEEGMFGVIPGNMRDGCFIVKGKGNKDYLCSSSHGAGRVLSRSQAKKQITLEKMQQDMAGIVGCISESTIDEAPDAYKNIFEVMDLQKDSVEVVAYLKPLLNIKG